MLVLASNVNFTMMRPLPGPTLLTYATPVGSDQVQPLGEVTPKLPLPDAALWLELVELRVHMQEITTWFTVKLWPPTEIVPERVLMLVLASNVKFTVPLPLPVLVV